MFMRFLIVISIAVLSGCANFNSIGRSSSLGGISNTENVAIHLDAQQRVVLSKKDMDKVCSEPNPDAMAAYAAALGLGVQIPRIGGGSLAQGGSSSIADIGLRTQSITLMRDALYRICEASMNGTINEYHMPPLLVRGMDLTAVVLATEQLTGAVVASQAALVASAKASATASGSEMLRANEQALAIAEAEAKEMSDKSTTADADLTAQDTKVENAQAQVNSLIAQSTANPSDKDVESKLSSAKETFKNEQAEQKKLQDAAARAKEELKRANKLVADIKETREGVLRQMSTSTNVETSGDKSFNNPSGAGKSLHENSEKNIAAVAIAVKEMVQHVLDKDYSAEGCLSYIGNNKASINHAITPDSVPDQCTKGLVELQNKKHALAMEKLKIDKLELEVKKLELQKELQSKNNEKQK